MLNRWNFLKTGFYEGINPLWMSVPMGKRKPDVEAGSSTARILPTNSSTRVMPLSRRTTKVLEYETRPFFHLRKRISDPERSCTANCGERAIKVDVDGPVSKKEPHLLNIAGDDYSSLFDSLIGQVLGQIVRKRCETFQLLYGVFRIDVAQSDDPR